MSAIVNIIFLNEQDSRICHLHLTFFIINNHYLSKVFQSLYQYFTWYDCCIINEIVILLVVIYQKLKEKCIKIF